MNRVTKQNVTEYQPDTFTAEASELGLAPGEVPQQLATDLGNGQPFRLVHVQREILYRQEAGSLQLVVFND